MSNTFFYPVPLNEPPLNYVNASNAATIGPTNAVHYDSPGIQKKGSGIFFVNTGISGTLNAQDTVSITLQRDGSTNLNTIQTVVPGSLAGSTAFLANLSWIDVPGDGLSHFYRIIATAAVGTTTVTVPISNADFQIFELGS
jgi:hypothetical protein